MWVVGECDITNIVVVSEKSESLEPVMSDAPNNSSSQRVDGFLMCWTSFRIACCTWDRRIQVPILSYFGWYILAR